MHRFLFFSFFFFLFVLPASTATVPVGSGDPVTTNVALPAKISAKDFKKLTGRKPTFKEKVALFLYNHKLVKPKPNGDKKKGARLGRASLFTAIGSWLLLFLVGGIFGVLGIVGLSFAFVLGIKALREKKGDGAAIAGIILSSLFFLLLLIGLAILIIEQLRPIE
jgi:hypothetical protein